MGRPNQQVQYLSSLAALDEATKQAQHVAALQHSGAQVWLAGLLVCLPDGLLAGSLEGALQLLHAWRCNKV